MDAHHRSDPAHLVARPRFTLIAVVSRDGFLARYSGERPSDWTSREEQALFQDRMARLDWSFMGRITHETAPAAHRRRVVFTSRQRDPLWRRERQLWLDPSSRRLVDIVELLRPVHPPRDCGILGGTRVHDWFEAHGVIDRIELTVEPLRFERGVPLFSRHYDDDPLADLAARGFEVASCRTLNGRGTRHYELLPKQLRSSGP